MKVFISWSGETSHQVALALHNWLPKMLQFVAPYISSEDIEKGDRWSHDIASELEAAGFGVICVTAENTERPWLNFEAGALAKTLEARVAPLLFGVSPASVTGPLASFQATHAADKDDVLKLVKAVNVAGNDRALDPQTLDDSFDVWWEHLETAFNGIEPESGADTNPPRREVEDMTEEVLELVREHQRTLRELVGPNHRAFEPYGPADGSSPRANLMGRHVAQSVDYNAVRAMVTDILAERAWEPDPEVITAAEHAAEEQADRDRGRL